MNLSELEASDGATDIIRGVLGDFPELGDTGPFTTDLQYMRVNEAKYLVLFAYQQLCTQSYISCSRPGTATKGLSDQANPTDLRKAVDSEDVSKRKLFLEGVSRRIEEIIEIRLRATAEAAFGPAKERRAGGKGRGRPRGNSLAGPEQSEEGYHWMPRLYLLCSRYRLSPVESSVLHIIVIVQGSNNSHVVSNLSEEDYIKRILLLRRLSKASEIDIETFCDPERMHCKEGLVTSEEEHGLHFNVRCSRTAVQILYGLYTTGDDLLKVSQTELEAILTAEREHAHSGRTNVHSDKDVPHLQSSETTSSSHLAAVAVRKRDAQAAQLDSAVGTGSPSTKRPRGGRQAPLQRNSGSAEMEVSDEEFSDEEGESELEDEPEEETQLGPYHADDQLEYLEEGFKIVALMVRTNAARLKDDMKKEGTKVTTWDGSDIRGVRRELQAKMLLTERRIERRLLATRALLGSAHATASETDGQPVLSVVPVVPVATSDNADAESGAEGGTHSPREVGLPRLEVLAERLKLDAFEKRMILLLIGKTVSPVVKALIDNVDQLSTREDVVTVGQALAILCVDFQTQIANRKYFYRSGRLLSNGIISLARSRWHQGSGDLTDQRITLDRRVLDWAVGLDSEINELVEGSDIYEPRVELSQVVLAPGQLGTLLQQCRAYAAFTRFRLGCLQLNKNRMSYGNGLIILLCGKSGTGKTMTVNAVAKDLGKKVLLVDFGSLSGRKDGAGDLDADLRGLFREAHMSNAVLFFDECEAAFRSRDRGGDRLLNALLTEIERHEGIVFMATNRPHDIDEAMHRRITTVVPYAAPDYGMRLRIWSSLLSTVARPASEQPDGRLRMADDVDVASLAVKYELTGGFIKNAILTAVLCALSREREGGGYTGEDQSYYAHNRSLDDAVNLTIGAAKLEKAVTIGGHSAVDSAVLRQADLIAGCRLQMRGAMNISPFEDRLIPDRGLEELHLSPAVREAGKVVVRFEKARARVYGTWAGWAPNILGGSQLAGALSRQAAAQKCCLCAIAGPTGYGKRTFIRGVCYDLGRPLKMVHASSVLGGSTNGSMAEVLHAVEELLRDARLADAVIALDGFEHVLLEEGAAGGGDGRRLNVLLSRLLGLLQEYPGCVFLVCHIENPQNISLQRDFASRLFCFIRQSIPLGPVRAKLWASLMPAGAPVAEDVNYVELGKRFELGPSSIQAAVQRACAEAAYRGSQRLREVDGAGTMPAGNEVEFGAHVTPYAEERVRMADLHAAGDIEVIKLRDQYFEVTSRMFT